MGLWAQVGGIAARARKHQDPASLHSANSWQGHTSPASFYVASSDGRATEANLRRLPGLRGWREERERRAVHVSIGSMLLFISFVLIRLVFLV